MILYPTGYSSRLVTLDALFAEHHQDKMHPEFARRLRAWLEAQDGRIGIGGSWRSPDGQPDKPGFAPAGKSFHQSQQFPSGSWFAAVDLVAKVTNGQHRSPRWDEVPDQGSVESRDWGVHCNVSTEAWHMQPIELDGWQTWVDAGRPDLRHGYPLPVDPTEDDIMPKYLARPGQKYTGRGAFIVLGGDARYATAEDVKWAKANSIPEVVLPDDQYANMYRQVFGTAP